MNFGRPSQLPTPPETDTDFLVNAHHTIDFVNGSSAHIGDPDMMNPHPSMGAPLRRVSTLSYHSSPLRDPRERANVRQSRWLIIVIPPMSLVQDHGPLGHTLSSGPSQRLSQGVLMPLQPTMYGQLNAIAREFNFPSPVGICLYLHVEHGFTMTPRILDESWPALWGHLFEARSPAPANQTPICGRIEFDIDRRKARWLDSWIISADRRHPADVPVSVPPSVSHGREDSKHSLFDEPSDERTEPSGLLTDSRGRHIPKKLSLVDKLETLALTSSVANAIAESGGVRAMPTSLTAALEGDEQKTTKNALEKRVESWRVSSSVAPTPLATADRIHLDPVHAPNNIQLSDIDIMADTDGGDDINLNDFAWSVSSVGPPDYESLGSAVSTSYLSSVHLDRRLEGSILLSPSTATSWGPETLENSPISILFRLPSPDIGQRTIEDCPPTPFTTTSWGPEELLYSPASVVSRLPSPDLGQRMLGDCPPTPITASSWRREDPVRLLVFPYWSVPSRPAWMFVWPFYNLDNAPEVLSSQFTPSLGRRTVTSLSGFPLYVSVNWVSSSCIDTSEKSVLAPTSVIYPLVYPFLSIHIPPPANQGIKQEFEHYPMRDSYSPQKLSTQYPHFDLYPPQYPFVTPYPPRTVPLFNEVTQAPGSDTSDGRIVVDPELIDLTIPMTKHSNSRQVQSLDLSGCAPLYPTFDIYPLVAEPSEVKGISIRLAQEYPRIALYSVVYPDLDIYPPVVTGDRDGSPKTVPTTEYPRIQPYPVVYPWFEIYRGYFSAGENDIATSRSVSLPQPAYPRFDLFPAVYPYFDIYRTGFAKKEDRRVSLSVILLAQYPAFNLLHGNVVSRQNPPVIERMSSLVHGSTGYVASTHVPCGRTARKTHKELHEEVFGAGLWMCRWEESKCTIEPMPGTCYTHSASLRTASSPPIPMSKGPSLRELPHNVEERDGSLSTPSLEGLDLPTVQQAPSHLASNAPSSLTHQGESIVQAHSPASANLSPRKDHGHTKHGHRPRDSLVLEKARFFDHLHAPSHNNQTPSVVDEPAPLPVPPVPQLPFNTPHPRRLDHSKYPFA
ncbi:hypothetical protein F5148DRAFT_1191453 [Russula earlei]|uniref:Uncharacterized protein n=1 Tax=Russula earlei TaxID=71964 RepID=A0ACC0UC56_9AGAM|nr:hypothetical protein F5148DRAFT_1191453 [Russula earlei]